MTVNERNLKIGGKYNWRNQPERLIYMGRRLYPGDLVPVRQSGVA